MLLRYHTQRACLLTFAPTASPIPLPTRIRTMNPANARYVPIPCM